MTQDRHDEKAREIVQAWQTKMPVKGVLLEDFLADALRAEAKAGDKAREAFTLLSKMSDERCERYRKALEWYATEGNFEGKYKALGDWVSPVGVDRGSRAREALAAPSSEGDES